MNTDYENHSTNKKKITKRLKKKQAKQKRKEQRIQEITDWYKQRPPYHRLPSSLQRPKK